MSWADPRQDGRPAVEESRLDQPADKAGPGSTAAVSPQRPPITLPGLLGRVAIASDRQQSEAGSRVLDASSAGELLRAWAAVRVGLGERLSREQLLIRLGDDVAALDEALAQQVDAVLHHPEVQRLE